jgi:hypothetical protein
MRTGHSLRSRYAGEICGLARFNGDPGNRRGSMKTPGTLENMNTANAVRARSIDHDRSIAALATAFSADPLIRWMSPGPGQYPDYFPLVPPYLAGGALAHSSTYRCDDFKAHGARACARWRGRWGDPRRGYAGGRGRRTSGGEFADHYSHVSRRTVNLPMRGLGNWYPHALSICIRDPEGRFSEFCSQ